MNDKFLRLLILSFFTLTSAKAFIHKKNVCLLDLQAYFSHDMTVNNSDIQGDTFVGGDAYLNYFEINGELAVRNYLSANHGTITGQSYASSSDFSYVGRRKHSENRSNRLNELNNIFREQMFKLSNKLYDFEANTQYSLSDGKIRIFAKNEISVVNMSASVLKDAYKLTLEADDKDRLLIINIDSENLEEAEFFRMTLELEKIKPENIIYNFYNARRLTLGMVGPFLRKYGTGIQGTVIAPLADINFFMGVIDGGLYGRSLLHTRPTGQVDPLKICSKLIRRFICH